MLGLPPEVKMDYGQGEQVGEEKALGERSGGKCSRSQAAQTCRRHRSGRTTQKCLFFLRGWRLTIRGHFRFVETLFLGWKHIFLTQCRLHVVLVVVATKDQENHPRQTNRPHSHTAVRQPDVDTLKQGDSSPTGSLMGLHRARSGIGDGPWLCKRNHGGRQTHGGVGDGSVHRTDQFSEADQLIGHSLGNTEHRRKGNR